MRTTALAVAVLAVALVGCDPGQTPARTRHTTPPVVQETISGTALGCSVGPKGEADRDCDPGATNPDVTQATIHQTICVPNWSDSVRPSTSYTSRLRDAEMLLYYPPGTPVTSVRQDHLIAQSLGGHLTDPRNLWPQPYEASKVKDNHSNRLRVLVCSREMTLQAAQHEILDTWTH